MNGTVLLAVVLLLCVPGTLQQFTPNEDSRTIINNNVAIVNNLAQKAQQEYADRCSCNTADIPCSQLACRSPLGSVSCTTSYGSQEVSLPEICSSKQKCLNRKVDLQQSVVRYPSTDPSSISSGQLATETCWTHNMDVHWRSGLSVSLESITLRWQYIGAPTGMFRIYPGSPQETCNAFDPRNRPWYVAATSGPKNVILVIDVSGSMGQFSRLDLAKEAAKTVVNTLTNFDFVGIVTFSASATTQRVNGNNIMVPATNENLLTIGTVIDQLTPQTTTNFEAAFTETFNLLARSKQNEADSGCHTAILFLTDGDPTAGSVTDEAGLRDHVSTMNSNPDGSQKAIIFTFTLGSSASENIPKAIACANRGIFIPVPDNGDLRGSMSQYYDYFSALRQQVDDLQPVWVEPYVDALGLGEITTVSRALYDNSTGSIRLYGVVGIDILIKDLRNADPDNWQSTINYLARQVRCPAIREVSNCQLDAIRLSRGNAKSLCENSNDCSSASGDSTSSACPSHGTSPHFCSSNRASFPSESCCEGSPLEPTCNGVSVFNNSNYTGAASLEPTCNGSGVSVFNNSNYTGAASRTQPAIASFIVLGTILSFLF